MKFRDTKTGEVFAVKYNECNLRFCKGFNCEDCPVRETNYTDLTCSDWVNANPYEAAALMGYEVVDDEPDSEKDVPTTQDKPIVEWTLSECNAYCKSRNGNCADDCIFSRHGVGFVCKVAIKPRDWDLTEPILWTEQDKEDAKIIMRVFPYAVDVKRYESKNVCVRGKGFIIGVNKDLFLSIKPNETVQLSEIIREGNE